MIPSGYVGLPCVSGESGEWVVGVVIDGYKFGSGDVVAVGAVMVGGRAFLDGIRKFCRRPIHSSVTLRFRGSERRRERARDEERRKTYLVNHENSE